MASGDPFLWTSTEVSHFFRHCIPRFLSENDIRGLKLPDTDFVADQLQQNELDGRDLLEAVDRDLLQNEIGITSLKQRLSVIHIINALRKASTGYVQNKASSVPISLPALPTPCVSAPQTPTIPTTSTHSTATKIRKNEVLFEDASGRKRRKLDLTIAPIPVSEGIKIGAVSERHPDEDRVMSDASSSEKHAQKLDRAPFGYLPDNKSSVDDIFYGKSGFGCEIRLPDTAAEEDEEYENFSFVAQPGLAGNASFVHDRLRHFFQRRDTRSITYHRRPALAIYPYPDIVIGDKDSRSVTVVQADEGNVRAFREKDITLAYQNDEKVDAQADPGTEWSFLLKKYNHANNEELLPQYGDSESGEMGEPTESGSGSGDDEAEEEPQSEGLPLSKESASIVIDRVIEDQIQAWHVTREPKLSRNMAREIWRKAKGKRAMVKGFTQQAEKAIYRLDDRLGKWIQGLAESSWVSESELERACEALEVTVHDREKERWKIQIWAQKDEPPHEVKARKQPHRAESGVAVNLMSQGDADDDMRGFINDDSLTFVDARETVESDQGSSQDLEMQEDESADARIDDEMAELPEAFDQDHQTVGPDDEEGTVVPEAFDHSDRDEPRQHSPPPRIPTGHLITEEAVRTPQDDRFFVPPLNSPDQLPSPSSWKNRLSQLSSQRKKAKSDPIVISSSPIQSPVKPSQEVKKEVATFSDDPDKDPISAYRKWDWLELEDRQDRQRLMLKLIYHMEDDDRKSLLLFMTGNMPKCVDGINFGLACLREGREDSLKKAESLAARLYSCYVFVDHELFQATLDKFTGAQGELPFENEEDVTADLRNWHAISKKALQKIDRYASSATVIELSDDNDDGEARETTKSSNTRTRKRTVKESRSALNMRIKARERAQKESQTSNSLALAQMLDDGVVPENVAIYAPDDVEATQHVYLNPKIANRMKPHQIEGVKFMFREITAPKEDDGQGCLLAHTMGLGKTAQSIALIVTIAETAHSKERRGVLPKEIRKKKLRVLVLCPPTLLQNWRQEIKLWCPPGTQDHDGVLGTTYCIESSNSVKSSRIDDLQNWREKGGILLCGYQMFSRLVDGKLPTYTEDEVKLVQEILLQKPQLVIADEVHSIKNETTSASKAAHKIKTTRRIGLTGSPMSNNTQEIYALINWVAPGFLGSATEFKANYAEPIVAGTYVDSDRSQVRKSLKKLAALKHIIAPKLNRADITVLKGSLKSKVEFVLTIPLTTEQQLPYQKYVELVLKSKTGEEGTPITQVRLFGWLAILQLLCNHPEAFRKKLIAPFDQSKQKKSTKKLSLTNTDTTSPVEAIVGGSPGAEEDDAPGDEHVSNYDISNTDIQQLLSALPAGDAVEFSYKTMLVRQIINLSVAAGDKVLLFSHSIPSLDYLDTLLTKLKLRFGRIQGDYDQAKRQKVLAQMGRDELDVLLISTRAGGLGLNIQQANRVIIFDFGFNPTWEEQAVGRVYRLGQTKPVYVYRFVAGGTFEWQLYDKQIFKTGLSSRVVDRKNPVRNTVNKPSEWLYHPQQVEQEDIYSEAGKDPQVMDKIIGSHRDGNDSFVRNIKTMETLMEDAKDEALTAEELREVEMDIAEASSRKKTFHTRTTMAPPNSNKKPAETVDAVQPGGTHVYYHGPLPSSVSQARESTLPPEQVQDGNGAKANGPGRIIGRY